MKKFGLKAITWYGIIALLVAVALLPILKAAKPQYFPSSYSGFRDLDCQGVTCPEGKFCAQNKTCVSIASRYPESVPQGNV